MDEHEAIALLAAAAIGDADRVTSMLPACGSPCIEGPSGWPVTPLMAAAAGGHAAVVALLLRCGADPSRRDRHGRSAAHHARAAGHHHLAERLDTVVDKERTIW